MQKNHFLLLKKLTKYRKCPALFLSLRRCSLQSLGETLDAMEAARKDLECPVCLEVKSSSIVGLHKKMTITNCILLKNCPEPLRVVSFPPRVGNHRRTVPSVINLSDSDCEKMYSPKSLKKIQTHLNFQRRPNGPSRRTSERPKGPLY